MSERLLLDLNDSEFQENLFNLTKEQQTSLLGTLKKLSQMTWDQVYRDAGLKWEAIVSAEGPEGKRIYSSVSGKVSGPLLIVKANG